MNFLNTLNSRHINSNGNTCISNEFTSDMLPYNKFIVFEIIKNWTNCFPVSNKKILNFLPWKGSKNAKQFFSSIFCVLLLPRVFFLKSKNIKKWNINMILLRVVSFFFFLKKKSKHSPFHHKNSSIWLYFIWIFNNKIAWRETLVFFLLFALYFFSNTKFFIMRRCDGKKGSKELVSSIWKPI